MDPFDTTIAASVIPELAEKQPEPEPEPEPEYKKTKSKKPKIDFEKIKKTDNFKYYMNGNIKSTEAVELYKALG
ncbi:MAG: hypothetical protein ACK53Y_07120, partial [bacterium]